MKKNTKINILTILTMRSESQVISSQKSGNKRKIYIKEVHASKINRSLFFSAVNNEY